MLKSLLNPKVRVALFLVLLNGLWVAAAALWLDRSQWLWVTPLALSINFLLLAYDQVLTFSHLQAKPLVGTDPWGLLNSVHELSSQFALRPPDVFLLDHPSAQIFTYAKTGRKSRLFVTTGLLGLLNSAELRAVLTYQMVAMQSSFTFLNYWLGAAVDLMLRIGEALESVTAFILGWTPPLKKWFVSPWIGLFKFFLIGARDFEKLDKKTALKIAHPEDLAKALWKMESYAQTQPWREAWVFSHMCMVSPFAAKPTLRWLTAQPALSQRIKRLVGRYPL